MAIEKKPYCTKEELLSLFGRELSSNPAIQKALDQAQRTHHFQIRDDGTPYLEQHIYPIVEEVYQYFKDSPERDVAIIVALLHDVLEEDPVITHGYLREEHGDKVMSLLLQLQKTRKIKKARSQKDKHDEHIFFGERLKKAPRLCQVIKILDRINNTECSNGTSNSLKYKRFVKDTEVVYIPLAELVDPTLALRMRSGVELVKKELQL